jgi:hypothetical protein
LKVDKKRKEGIRERMYENSKMHEEEEEKRIKK